MEHSERIALQALRLQLHWGADEALREKPLDRLRPDAPAPDAPGFEPPASAAASDTQPVAPRARQATSGMPAARMAQAAADAAGTLPALRAAIEGFERCPLRDTATSLVFADGPDDAQVMLVGDAPGPDEDRAGRPFAGSTGAYLDRMLASIGLDRGTVRMATLLPWRPPGNRSPTEGEIAVCLPFLLRHIGLVRPAYLLIAGPHSGAALAKEGARRGRRNQAPSWVETVIPNCGRIPALLLPAPAMTRTTPVARRDTWRALCFLRRTLNGP